jgi:hypothetical protein
MKSPAEQAGKILKQVQNDNTFCTQKLVKIIDWCYHKPVLKLKRVDFPLSLFFKGVLSETFSVQQKRNAAKTYAGS